MKALNLPARARARNSRNVVLTLGAPSIEETCFKINEGSIEREDRRVRPAVRSIESHRCPDFQKRGERVAGNPIVLLPFGARELGSANPFRARDPRRACKPRGLRGALSYDKFHRVSGQSFCRPPRACIRPSHPFSLPSLPPSAPVRALAKLRSIIPGLNGNGTSF